jgi:hypothetical protein
MRVSNGADGVDERIFAHPARYIMALESRVAKLEHALAQIDPLHPEINDHYNPSDSPPRSESTGGRQGTHRPVDQFDETPSFTFAKIVKR